MSPPFSLMEDLSDTERQRLKRRAPPATPHPGTRTSLWEAGTAATMHAADQISGSATAGYRHPEGGVWQQPDSAMSRNHDMSSASLFCGALSCVP